MTTESTEYIPKIEMLAPSEIRPSPLNPRKTFRNDDKLDESVAVNGVIAPLLTRPVKHPNGVTREIVYGERRWRAATKAKLKTVPVMTRDLSDEEALELMIEENSKRTDVHPIEEARSFHEWHHRFKRDVAKIAEKIGRPPQYVYDRMRLLSLTKAAQEMFLDGALNAGHAVILSRLKPEDQTRALDPKSFAVFEPEASLWNDPRGDGKRGEIFKLRTAAELQAWVDKHVRFDADVDAVPELFPETAHTVAAAKLEGEKIVQITYEYQTPPDARDGSKIYTPQAWRRADGREKSKVCDNSVIGVVAIGPLRSEAFDVCIAKKTCTTHWGPEIREAKERVKEAESGATNGEDRAAKERVSAEEHNKKIREERERYTKAGPALVAALNARVKALPVKAHGVVADLLAGFVDTRQEKAALPRGKTAEDLARHLVSGTLAECALDPWSAQRRLPQLAKKLVIDVEKIVKAANGEPVETKTEPKRVPVKGAKKKPAASKKSTSKRTAKR